MPVTQTNNPNNVFGPYSAAAGPIQLPGGGDSNITTLVVLIVGTGWTGSLSLVGVPCRSGLGAGSGQALGYTTPAASTPSTTAPAASGLFWYRVDGCNVFATIAASAGSVTFYVHVLNG